jgi:hypothetical protein
LDLDLAQLAVAVEAQEEALVNFEAEEASEVGVWEELVL